MQSQIHEVVNDLFNKARRTDERAHFQDTSRGIEGVFPYNGGRGLPSPM